MWPTEANNGAGTRCRTWTQQIRNVCVPGQATLSLSTLDSLLRPGREGDQCKLKLSAVALGNVALARSLAVSLTLCECRASEGWL